MYEGEAGELIFEFDVLPGSDMVGDDPIVVQSVNEVGRIYLYSGPACQAMPVLPIEACQRELHRLH